MIQKFEFESKSRLFAKDVSTCVTMVANKAYLGLDSIVFLHVVFFKLISRFWFRCHLGAPFFLSKHVTELIEPACFKTILREGYQLYPHLLFSCKWSLPKLVFFIILVGPLANSGNVNSLSNALELS